MPKLKIYFVRVITYDGDLLEYTFSSHTIALQWFDFIVNSILIREIKQVGAVYLCVNDWVYRSYVHHNRLRQHIKFQQLKDL